MIEMEKIRIGDACDILNGYAFKSDRYVDDGIRIIRIANVQKGYIEDNAPVFYPINSCGLNKYMLEEGDLLMSLTGNVGRVALLQKEMLPAVLNQRVACLRLKTDRIIRRFLFHILNSDFFEQKCIQVSNGVAQKNMSTEWLKDYEIPLYPIEEQLIITEVLDMVRNIISSMRDELSKLDNLIKARFVEMFGSCKDMRTMEDLCLIITDGTHQPPRFQEKGIPFIFVSNLSENKVTYNSEKFISDETYNELIKRTPIEKGDILLSTVGSYGHPAVVIEETKFLFQRHIAYLKPKHDLINSFYLHSVLLSPDAQRQIEEKVRGIAQKTLNLSEIREIIVPVPSMEQQIVFEHFVRQVDKSKVVDTNIIQEDIIMEINFTFLEEKREYDLFAGACIDAERILVSSPVMSAVASRKALELCVKWVYSIDSALKPIEYREGLQSLLHNNGFPSLMDYTLWKRLQYIVKNGNESVHTSKSLDKDDAILSLNILFDFVQWIDYCYGRDYIERFFDESKIPNATKEAETIQEQYKQVIHDVQKNADKIVDEKDKEIERLLKINEELRQQMKEQKSKNQKEREYTYDPNMPEWLTRKRYIDADLKANGYIFDQNVRRNCIEVEYPVVGMPNETGTGSVDYVIWGDTGRIIAVLEAKRTGESADKGQNQGKLYADCIQNMQGFRPVIFYTNGFETYLWDDENSAPRVVSGMFPQKDINAMIERRYIKKPVNSIQIDEEITNRWYQLRAVTKCCENYEKGIRKCLLVMATGTGKTRTAASVVDVMTRSQQMRRVLFLADRKELVKQAKNAFSSYIPNTTMCNLLLNKDERNANIVFSTYPTILNAIDTMKNSDGSRFFSPGHFDLIIIDDERVIIRTKLEKPSKIKGLALI